MDGVSSAEAADSACKGTSHCHNGGVPVPSENIETEIRLVQSTGEVPQTVEACAKGLYTLEVQYASCVEAAYALRLLYYTNKPNQHQLGLRVGNKVTL